MVVIVSVLIIGLLAVSALGYAVQRHRERARWANVRNEQLKRLGWLKKEIGR